MMPIAIRFLRSAAMQQALFIEIDTEIAERQHRQKFKCEEYHYFNLIEDNLC